MSDLHISSFSQCFLQTCSYLKRNLENLNFIQLFSPKICFLCNLHLQTTSTFINLVSIIAACLIGHLEPTKLSCHVSWHVFCVLVHTRRCCHLHLGHFSRLCRHISTICFIHFKFNNVFCPNCVVWMKIVYQTYCKRGQFLFWDSRRSQHIIDKLEGLTMLLTTMVLYWSMFILYVWLGNKYGKIKLFEQRHYVNGGKQ